MPSVQMWARSRAGAPRAVLAHARRRCTPGRRAMHGATRVGSGIGRGWKMTRRWARTLDKRATCEMMDAYRRPKEKLFAHQQRLSREINENGGRGWALRSWETGPRAAIAARHRHLRPGLGQRAETLGERKSRTAHGMPAGPEVVAVSPTVVRATGSCLNRHAEAPSSPLGRRAWTQVS